MNKPCDLGALDTLIAEWMQRDQHWHRHNGHCNAYRSCANELARALKQLRDSPREFASMGGAVDPHAISMGKQSTREK